MDFISRLCGYHITARWKAVGGKPEACKEILRLWHTQCEEKDKRQVTQFMESVYAMKESIGINWKDKAQKILDLEVDLIKINRSVQVPGLKRAYYVDKQAGYLVAGCIMALISKVKSKQMFHSLDQPKGSGTCYSLSVIDMYDMEAREAIHNLAAYLGHHSDIWVCTYFTAVDLDFAQTCYWNAESQTMISNKEHVWDDLSRTLQPFMWNYKEQQPIISWGVLTLCHLWIVVPQKYPIIQVA
jgi:hypothetical protein